MSSSSSVVVGDTQAIPPLGSQAKVMHDRVSYVEHHLGKICGMLSDYALKTAALRDKNDEIAKALSKFSVEEKYNTTTKLAMIVVSELIANVGDHRNAEVQRLEAKVLPPLSSYGNMCKHLKTDIKNAHNAEDRHVARFKDVERLKDRAKDPKYQSSITLADAELEKASAESYRLNFFCQDQLLKFEQKRIVDVKESLQTFVKIELLMHSKALELFSQAYQFVESIDEDADLESLKCGMALNKVDTAPRQCMSKKKKSTGQVWRSSTLASTRTTKEIGRTLEAMMNLRASTPKKCQSEGGLKHSEKKKVYASDATSGCSSDGDLLKYDRSEPRRQKKSKHTKSKDKKAVSFGQSEDDASEGFEKMNYNVSNSKHGSHKSAMKKSYL